jgi:hypothetical protein
LTALVAMWVMGHTLAADGGDAISLTLVPPSPVTDQIVLDIRVGVRNGGDAAKSLDVTICWDKADAAGRLHSERIEVPAGAARGVAVRVPLRGRSGRHEVLVTAVAGATPLRASRPIDVVASAVRSTGRIDGAWAGFYHWSEQEGRPWNAEIGKMTDAQWGDLIRAMHEIRMDVIVIQEVFRNQAYRGRHAMDREGYAGKAFYPSRLYPGRMPIAAHDPVEAVFSQADRLGMTVFAGLGHYAFFDFSRGSLEWHKRLADELWAMYGHHPSFYGWYVSAEIAGNLGGTPETQREVVEFFRDLRPCLRRLAPDKPVMLATNSHCVPAAVEVYPKLLEQLDILCPFGFHRPPAGDIRGEEAAALLQRLCDQAGTHLWMDLEVFLFGARGELVPRPIDGLISDLRRFPTFEKVLCYQFPGLMNAPWASIVPGGADTVRLYNDYRKFVEQK